MKKIIPLLLSCLFIMAPGAQAAVTHAHKCKGNGVYNTSTGMCVVKRDIGIAGG